jgi:rubredoxin
MTTMKKFQCFFCDFIYDEAEGLPEEDIPPGTRWEDIPDDWVCPECGAAKEDFAMMEID